MSEAAKAARAALKAKAQRLVRTDPKGVVDASGYTPPDALDADVKTGARPISQRLYKRGGKVKGADAIHHSGRKPRKSGGGVEAKEWVKAKINRNVRSANEERDGTKHIGGFKKGGKVRRQHHADGGPGIDYDVQGAGDVTRDRPTRANVPVPPRRRDYFPSNRGEIGGEAVTKGGKPVSGADLYGSTPSDSGMKRGGRAHKDGGGFIDPRRQASMAIQNAAARAGVAPNRMSFSPVQEGTLGRLGGLKRGGMAHPDVAEDKALIRKMVKGEALTGKKDGGETGGKWIQKMGMKKGALHE